MIIDKKELEKALREGEDPDVIRGIFVATLETIQNKINAETSSTAEANSATNEPRPHISDNNLSKKQQQSESEIKTKPNDKNDKSTESILNTSNESVDTCEDFETKESDDWIEFWRNSFAKNKTKEKKKEGREPHETEQGVSATKQTPATAKDTNKKENKIQDESKPNSNTLEIFAAVEQKLDNLITLLNSSTKKTSQNKNSESAKMNTDSTIAEKTDHKEPTTSVTLDTLINMINELIVDNPYAKDCQEKQKKENEAGAGYVTDKAEPRIRIKYTSPWLSFPHYPFFWF